MILPEGNPFGEIRGLIRCTPEEAIRDFGFAMREDAQGVIFRGYTYLSPNGKKLKGTFLSNYIPSGNPQTIPQQAWRTIMHDAVVHWQLLHLEEKNIYRQRAKKMNMSGFNLHNKEYLQSHS